MQKSSKTAMILFHLGVYASFSTWGVEASAPAYKMENKTVMLDELIKQDQAGFYEIKKQEHQKVVSMAKSAWLDKYWDELAKKEKKSVEDARNTWFEKNAKISDKEVNETLNKFKDHPQLSKLEDKEKVRQIREYLMQEKRASVLDALVEGAMKAGKLAILFPEPAEPSYDFKIEKDDFIRYSARQDGKPVKCQGDDCEVVILEYSEAECTFCEKGLPGAMKTLDKYEGRIAWITRSYPLPFHKNARHAAKATICAGYQDKYFYMYHELFKNQRSLDLERMAVYAQNIADADKKEKRTALDVVKFNTCMKSSKEAEALIDKQVASGSELNVRGTPHYIIRDGGSLSGMLSFEKAEEKIEKMLAMKKATAKK